jgi:hypothetical protein
MLSMLAFPPREMDFLRVLPIQGYHLAVLTGIPLIITCIIAIVSKRYYKVGD